MVYGPNDRTGSRSPTRADIVRLARSLNEQGARYTLIGGIAMAFHGYARGTRDIDLLVDPSEENVALLKTALAILEDGASRDLKVTDIAAYGVVRVADEIVVDLLGAACNVQFQDIADEIEFFELDGVEIPVLSPRALMKTKQTVREKDAIDCQFLAGLIDDEVPRG